MTADLQPYPEYKDSGLPWLGEVPRHWEMVRNKLLFRRRKQVVGSNHTAYTLLSLTLRGVIKRDMENAKGKFPADFGTYQVVEPGDFVFCLFDVDETPRAVGVANDRGMITGAYTVFDCLADVPGYLFHYYTTLDDLKSLKPLYTGLRKVIPEDRFLRMRSPQPPQDEQVTIDRYLTNVTRQIARFIRNRRRLIEILNEQKQAIINRAVTQGLDPNAPRKSSGVEWLGEIPEHWERRRLKFLVRNVNEQTAIRQPDEVYIALEHVEGWTGRITLPSESIAFDSQVKRFRTGDVLFGKLRPYLAKVTRPDVPGVCVGEFLVLRVIDEGLLPAFLEQELRSKRFIDIINSSTFGAKIPRADWTFIGNLPVVYPPSTDEQIRILTTVECQTASLQAAIDRARREIDLIRDYRTRLIADVVTGKLDVRGLAPTEPLPEESEPDVDIDDDALADMDTEPGEEAANDVD